MAYDMMNIFIDQTDLVYIYYCTGLCDRCLMRFICYTCSKENTLTLRGTPTIDYLMLRSRIDGIITLTEAKRRCPVCLMDGKETLRNDAEECPVCGHYITCERCNVDDCEFRNDVYNIDGDCLATK